MILTWIIVSLILSALFSGSEIAFVSANKLKVELRKRKEDRRGAVIERFFDHPAQFLSTMLVGNNIALVIFTALMTRLLQGILPPGLVENSLLSLLLVTSIITVVVLIFGEFLPKTLFQLFADDILYFLAYPLRFLQLLLAFPTWMMHGASNLILKLVLTAPVEQVDQVFTRLDLENFITDTQQDPEEEIDVELFGKALKLRDVRVRDSMIPRPEIESLDVNSSLEELEHLFQETRLSRIIITEGEIDNVLGYVHHQQLLKDPPNIRAVILEIPFVPEVMPVTELMNRFIKSHTNIACVVDEFGGVSGIITLEDILEELFGEIDDEYDEEEHTEDQISDLEYLFSGRLEVDYLNDKYEHLQLPEGDYHTLSGYLVTTAETIPEQGAILEQDGYQFVLEAVSDTKIELVRVRKLNRDLNN